MQRRSPRRVLSLLLGISLVLGVSLTGVWSGDMAVQAANATSPGPAACLACGTDDGASETMDVCDFLCGVLASAVAPPPLVVVLAAEPASYAAFVPLGRDRTPSPERSPPRPTDLG